MKILLVNIPLRPSSNIRLFPVGLGYIATSIKLSGRKFDILDLDVLRWGYEEVESYFKRNAYDVVCIGCLVTGYKYVKRLAETIKEYNKECVIVAGNSVATSIPEILLKNTKVDIAVMGEGDKTIVDILNAIECQIQTDTIDGIYFKNNNGCVVATKPRELIKDISSLPFIDFDIFDVQTYLQSSADVLLDVQKEQEIRSLPISTARGCIANCTFCYHVFKGQRYRFRTAESIVAELIHLVEKYDINYAQFWDELTFFSKKQTEELVDAIISSGINIGWQARCRANLFSADEDVEIIKKMKKAGCQRVQYSLESSNAEILKAMNKNITPDQFSRQTELFNRAGLKPMTSLVFGFPQETPDTIKDSIDCCIKNGIYPSAGYLLPQPGSPVYKYAIDCGLIVDEEDYLIKMGDRQDLTINFTKMSDDEFKDTVVRELKRCNEVLGGKLDTESLIKNNSSKETK